MSNGSTVALTYDSLDRLSTLENRKGTGDLLSRYVYGYEGQNSTGDYAKRGITTFVESQQGTDSPQRSDYGYTPTNRLTSEVISQTTEAGTSPLRQYSYGHDSMPTAPA